MYLLRRGVHLQYDHNRGFVYDLYNVCDRNPCIDGLYTDRESCLYLLRRWDVL